ncbi:hypothetical protein CANARDRAFT_28182 [[Candida] arabinofermentans NRRL YB-2248]|uniref:peptidylprolyl isomerase n=1 Tax=[Candida] arabinofermentans NRRL YB-2248 TaxID=983967 RepID=A0A1E4T0Y6_9ASCO|nr:hypothetical protein CANARDRAFT_28182 [[Candida] arabinofermentans NRRL YB-2248]
MNLKNLILLTLIGSTYSSTSEEQLQIGIIKKIPEESCKRRTIIGDTIQVHYKGQLENGFEFDSSFNRNQPISFKLGIGQVIKGWDQGLLDMCIGEERKLIIPSKLGYGSRGAGGIIPPDSTLIFETKLVGIVNERDEL